MSNFMYGETVRANGILQHFLRYGGSGDPVLLIPGIASTAAQWGFVGDHIGQTNDCYVLDVRGRGLSSAGDGLDYGLNACARDVLSLIDVLGLKNCVIVGFSMGARIAIRAAGLRSSGMSGMLLLDPPVSGPGRRPYPITLEAMFAFLRMGVDGTIRDPANNSPGWKEIHNRLRAEWLSTCDFAAVAAAHRSFNEDDIHADLSRVSIPTALMVAGGAATILPDDLNELRQLIPDLFVETLDGVGHMMPFEAEDMFFASFDRMMLAVSRQTARA